MIREVSRSDVVAILVVAATIMVLLQFTLIGKLVYVGYVAFVIILILVVIWLSGGVAKKLKVIGVGAFVLITAPVAEEAWIAYRFEKVCEDAGVHVKRKVMVDGYLDSTNSSVHSSAIKEGPWKKESSDFEKQGYRYKESLLNDGRIMHLERKNGWIHISIRERPSARYHYVMEVADAKIGWKLYKTKFIVNDSERSETIGTRKIYSRYPSIIESLWIRYFDNGMEICPDPQKRPYQPSFPEAVMSPKDND